MSEKIEEFVSEISKCISDKTFLKLAFHKPKQGLLKKTNIEVFVDSEGFEKLKISNFSATQDFTEIKTISELSAVINAYSSKYDFIDLYATSYDLFLKKSKKGVVAIIKSKKKHLTPNQVNFGVHNKSKDYFIDASVGYLVDLGICDLNGKVKPSMYHKFRQINRFIEIISHHVVLKSGEPKIVDMGSGKGYLTFALQTYYSDILQQNPKIVGYELREDLVKLCQEITKKHHLSGLHFEASNILEVELSKIDMLIALHACDIATDMAIQKGILSSAQVILLSPCCHKQIRKEIKIKNDITKFGIYEERMAEMITDTIRSLLLNHFGYKTNIIEYISSEHTAKNTMIIAEYNGVSDKDALEKIRKIKAEYGIGKHYLEQLLFN